MVVAFINNSISAGLLETYCNKNKIPLNNLYLILGRKLEKKWFHECNIVCNYPYNASLHFLGQIKFIYFYLFVSIWVSKNKNYIKSVFITNSDNLICNNFINLKKSGYKYKLNILVEGLMNFQNITLSNRVKWRTLVKNIFANILGYKWTLPKGHLSGSYENEINEVITFTDSHIYAPKSKINKLSFIKIQSKKSVILNKVLFIETAIWQWMDEETQKLFYERLSRYLNSFKLKVIIKPHPNYSGYSDLLENLDSYEFFEKVDKSIEECAAELNYKYTVGTCTTSLITLKLIRNDLNIFDFGSDIYIPKAYGNDKSILKLFRDVGVKTIKSSEYK